MPDTEPPTRQPIENPYARWERSFTTQMVALRESKGMTQTDLAKVLSVSYLLPFHQQTIQRIEAGTRPVRLNEAHLIARALGSEVEMMTAELAPDVRELQYRVHTARRGAGETADEIFESLCSWVENLEALTFVLQERVAVETRNGDLTKPNTAWGLAWAVQCGQAGSTLLHAYELLRTLQNNAYELDHDIPVLSALAEWADIHSKTVKPYLMDNDSIAPAPSGEMSSGEHPEAP